MHDANAANDNGVPLGALSARAHTLILDMGGWPWGRKLTPDAAQPYLNAGVRAIKRMPMARVLREPNVGRKTARELIDLGVVDPAS